MDLKWYELEGSDKEIVVVNTKNNSSMGSNQPTEEGKVVAVETGSGSGSDPAISFPPSYI
jgi:hypothetical protein